MNKIFVIGQAYSHNLIEICSWKSISPFCFLLNFISSGLQILRCLQYFITRVESP